MKSVSISYNPYKLKTHITVDGKELAENSELRERSADGNRLQEWVEDLPDMLLNEFNDNKFAVSFHGIIMDYEDLKEVLDEAQEQHKFWYYLKWEKAQEVADKEKLIDEVFQEIQNGPFEELKSDEIKTAFQNAKSNDFEVCVVAPMSAGKSTLINAMLGKELMPSKAEACTAMITRIKDVDQQGASFRAEVYCKGKLSETLEELDYSAMERLNADDTVEEVRVYGNIPFVSSDELSLVLVDTPGPNNARDDSHEKVQQNALGKSSKALVLYIMTNEYGTDDDVETLNGVAETMSVGGKQSKDRFLFVVNKMDDRNKNDGSTEEALNRVREYLKERGINNPNLFPAAALPALNIRRMEKETVDEDIEEHTEYLIRKLNRNEYLHLEKHASLPGSIKEDIEDWLKKTKKEWEEKNGKKNENSQEALIHTGVISIEAAIRQYVEKYAKTARIKNITDTFLHNLDELQYTTKLNNELLLHQKEGEKIVKQISEIQNRISNIKSTKDSENIINQRVGAITKRTKNSIENIRKEYASKCNEKNMKGGDKGKISREEAEEVKKELTNFADDLSRKFYFKINEIIQEGLVKVCNSLLIEYKNKLKELSTEIDTDGIETINIDINRLMEGTVEYTGFSYENFIHQEERRTREWKENTNKKWYKPWTWFQEKGYYREKQDTVEFIEYAELAQYLLGEIELYLKNNTENAKNYIDIQIEKVISWFQEEEKQLDDMLRSKLSECKNYLIEKDKVEERSKETEEKLKWLRKIQEEMKSIIDC